MSVKFIQRGDAVDYTPVSDVNAGEVIVQGDLLGITKLDIAAGKLGALAVSGVFEFPKSSEAASAITAGAKVYWNAADGIITTESDDGGDPATPYPYVGKSIQAASDDEALVRVRLEQ